MIESDKLDPGKPQGRISNKVDRKALVESLPTQTKIGEKHAILSDSSSSEDQTNEMAVMYNKVRRSIKKGKL